MVGLKIKFPCFRLFYHEQYIILRRAAQASNIPVLNYLFYRHSYSKRMSFYYSKDGVIHCHSHRVQVPPHCKSVRLTIPLNDCDCDCFAKVKVVKEKLYRGARVRNGRRRTVTEMMHDVMIQIANEWTMHGTKLVYTDDRKAMHESYIRIKSMTSPNFVEIPPYFDYKGVTPSGHLKMPPNVAQKYMAFDMYYFKTILGREMPVEFFRDVWHQLREKQNVIPHPDGTVGIPWEWTEKSPPSLMTLCARRVSLHNKAFGGNKDGPACVYTLQDAVTKMPTVLQKLAQPTHTVFGMGRYLGDLTGRAMRLFIHCLGVGPYKRKRIWDFEEEMVAAREVPFLSSAGIRSGRDRTHEMPPYVFKVTVNGKKIDQLERAEAIIRKIARDIGDGEAPYNPDRAWALIAKNEVLCSMNDAELVKFATKCRLYNIPTVVIYMIARMVHGYRQKIERGKFISIGFNFWSGGAWILADKFRWDKGDVVYSMADFTGLDTTVKASLLQLYSSFSDYYHSPNAPDYDIFKGLLKMAAEALSFKCVHFSSGIWRMVYGGMPSGAYETSHGDSWIVALLMFQYFVSVAQKYPHLQQKIYDALHTIIMNFVVYGDDLILMVPTELAKYVNMKGFCAFVTDNYQMKMRDIIETRSFLSIPDQRTGDLIKKGVVFLSRYLVARESVCDDKTLPPVLPFRELTKTVKKFAFGNGEARNHRDRVLASLGMVYDSMGTNAMSYTFCRIMYEDNIDKVESLESVFEHYDQNDNRYMTNLLRKCNVSIEKLKEGFPSRESLLLMHRVNFDHHYTRERPEYEFVW